MAKKKFGEMVDIYGAVVVYAEDKEEAKEKVNKEIEEMLVDQKFLNQKGSREKGLIVGTIDRKHSIKKMWGE